MDHTDLNRLQEQRDLQQQKMRQINEMERMQRKQERIQEQIRQQKMQRQWEEQNRQREQDRLNRMMREGLNKPDFTPRLHGGGLSLPGSAAGGGGAGHAHLDQAQQRWQQEAQRRQQQRDLFQQQRTARLQAIERQNAEVLRTQTRQTEEQTRQMNRRMAEIQAEQAALDRHRALQELQREGRLQREQQRQFDRMEEQRQIWQTQREMARMDQMNTVAAETLRQFAASATVNRRAQTTVTPLPPAPPAPPRPVAPEPLPYPPAGILYRGGQSVPDPNAYMDSNGTVISKPRPLDYPRLEAGHWSDGMGDRNAYNVALERWFAGLHAAGSNPISALGVTFFGGDGERNADVALLGESIWGFVSGRADAGRGRPNMGGDPLTPSSIRDPGPTSKAIQDIKRAPGYVVPKHRRQPAAPRKRRSVIRPGGQR